MYRPHQSQTCSSRDSLSKTARCALGAPDTCRDLQFLPTPGLGLAPLQNAVAPTGPWRCTLSQSVRIRLHVPNIAQTPRVAPENGLGRPPPFWLRTRTPDGSFACGASFMTDGPASNSRHFYRNANHTERSWAFPQVAASFTSTYAPTLSLRHAILRRERCSACHGERSTLHRPLHLGPQWVYPKSSTHAVIDVRSVNLRGTDWANSRRTSCVLGVRRW